MVRYGLGLIFLITVVFYGSAALAQCKSDIDCKGARLCRSGTCVEPGAAAPSPTPQQPAPAQKWRPTPSQPAPEKQAQPTPQQAVPEPQAQPSAQQADPCAQITCSGHGNCIVRGGEATCACHTGYVPDQFGINCLVEAQPAPGPTATGTAATAPPPQTQESCVTEVDCGEGQICASGLCQMSTPTTPTSTPAKPLRRPALGFALTAGILGFTSSLAVLALSINSAITSDQAHNEYDQSTCWNLGDCGAAEQHEKESWIFGISALMTASVFTPIVYVGGRSVRIHPDVRGLLGFRITGWSLFGTAYVCAFAMIGIGAADERVPPPLIGVAGGFGMMGLVFLSIDALILRSQAKRVYL